MFKALSTIMICVGLGLLSAPSLAQTRTIGVLEYGSKAGFAPMLAAFKEGLREGGFVDGQNLRIEYRYADYDRREIERLAEELVQTGVQLIFAPTAWAVHGAKAATRTLPIVFAAVNDPISVKFVKSLAKPGGNITGVSVASTELTAKRIELMRDMFPAATRLAVMYDKDAARACQVELKDIGRAGRHLGIDVQKYPYLSKADLPDAFRDSQRAEVAAVLIPTTMEMRRFGSELITLAADTRIPTIHSSKEQVEAGGLMSYGPDPGWAYRRAGNYVARILKGSKPEDLPVEQPTTYELAVNLKTARALGVNIPENVLVRATHVIR